MSRGARSGKAAPPRWVPLLLGGLGAIFVGVGVWLLFTDGPRRESARVAALPLVDGTSLGSRAIGDVILLEGRIAADTSAGFRDFVAWRRYAFDGIERDGPNKGREKWKHLETVTPPLRLAATGGAVAIVNQHYEMRAEPHDWQETKSLDVGFFQKRPERASGFQAGDAVIVEGRVVAEPGAEGGALPTRALAADVLSSGNRAAYLAELEGAILAAKIIGGVFTPVGTLLLGLAGWLWRRGSRSRE